MSFITPDIDLIRIKKGLSEEVLEELWEEILSRNGKVYLRVVSGSMAPLFAVGDRVLVRKVRVKDIKVGNIVFFKGRNVDLAHRVVGKFYKNGQLYFLQRGDQGGPGGIVLAESVLGMVVAVEKNGRLLRLEYGCGRIANTFLGMHNYASYWMCAGVDAIKKKLSDKPGFQCLKPFYRILKKPFVFINRAMVRLLLAGMGMAMKANTRDKK